VALLTGDEIIEIAIRLEKRGEAFYVEAAESAITTSVKTLFEDLAEQERHHRRAFQRMGRDVVELALSPDQWDQFQAYAGALLEQSLFDKPEGVLSRATETMDEGEALEAALEFENETLLFFYELREAVRGPGQRVVERIAQEEKWHIQRLSALLAN
jgi:rubrerythrin